MVCADCGLVVADTGDASAPEDATEEASAESTESTAPTAPSNCNHDWQYRRSYTGQQALHYEDRTCANCGFFEVTYQPEAYYQCAGHDWVTSTAKTLDTIYEFRECTKCGGEEWLTHANPCAHTLKDEVQTDAQGNVRRFRECTTCGAKSEILEKT